MKKSFTLGAISGISALTIAFPLVAQLSSAQETGATVAGTQSSAAAKNTVFFKHKMDTTTAGIQARIDRDTAFLANIDAMIALQKTATQAHKDALTAALTISDDTQRAEAVKAAEEALRTTMKEAMEAHPAWKDAMPFGGEKHMMKMHGGPGKHMKIFNLSEKFDMTPEELKAAFDSGKTIEDLAKEKGVELPERPAFRGGMMKEEEDGE